MIDISRWDKRNVWMNNANDLVVREGMQHALNPYELGMNEFFGGFSIENPRTSDQLHYIIGCDDAQCKYGSLSCKKVKAKGE